LRAHYFLVVAARWMLRERRRWDPRRGWRSRLLGVELTGPV